MGHKSVSQYHGVSLNQAGGKFAARISINKKRTTIGSFDIELSAALAYDDFCRKNNLDRRLNFPDPEPENLVPNTRLIRLTQGKFAIVDEEDYDMLSKFEWQAARGRNTYYAGRTIEVDGIRKAQEMHHVIMNRDGLLIDHINHNGLDNRKINLRVCTNCQNMMNRVSFIGSKSKYKGVSVAPNGKFKSAIRLNGIRYYLGTFELEEDAARAFDSKAKELHGEFAWLNFPD